MPKVYDKANARTKPDWLKIRLKGNEEYAAGFSENPLANSANYEIYLKDISKQSALVKYLEGIEGVIRVRVIK